MHQRSCFSHLGWIYIALIGLWLALRAIFLDQIWWLALLNTFAIYVFVPLPPLLLFGLWRRHWALLLGLTLPTAAFLILFATLVLPKPTTVQVDAAITVMTFNVLTSNKDTDALVQAIRAAQPDILGMQELTERKRAALKAAFGAQLPYHTFDGPASFGNVGLMTRFPIETVQPITLPTGQPALDARLNVHGQQVHVFVAHLTPNHLFKNTAIDLGTAASNAFARRAAEVAFLHEKLRDLREPALLLCDCNLTDTSQAHAELEAFLTDSFREAGWGLRNTNDATSFPLQRIDYVWHSAGLVAITAGVGQAGGSDHLPVIVRLHIETPDGYVQRGDTEIPRQGDTETRDKETHSLLLLSLSPLLPFSLSSPLDVFAPLRLRVENPIVALIRQGSAAPTARAPRPSYA